MTDDQDKPIRRGVHAGVMPAEHLERLEDAIVKAMADELRRIVREGDAPGALPEREE